MVVCARVTVRGANGRGGGGAAMVAMLAAMVIGMHRRALEGCPGEVGDSRGAADPYG